MASITIMFMDGKNGVLNYSYTLKDEDLERLFKATAIARGTDKKYVEANSPDTNIVREVTQQLAFDFISNLKNEIFRLEINNIQEEAIRLFQPANINLQNQ